MKKKNGLGGKREKEECGVCGLYQNLGDDTHWVTGGVWQIVERGGGRIKRQEKVSQRSNHT